MVCYHQYGNRLRNDAPIVAERLAVRLQLDAQSSYRELLELWAHVARGLGVRQQWSMVGDDSQSHLMRF
jgi:hypothetical protein